MSTNYYSERLSADRLHRCYAIAPPRVAQYLEAEVAFVADRIRSSDTVLELGCAYGRVMRELAARSRTVVGIDTSHASLLLARAWLEGLANYRLARMDAAAPAFADGVFDVVVCIQNGISAFHVEPRALIQECLRVTRPGGRVLLSSYAEKFWKHRLEWFRRQAAEGLLGELDETATRDGVIACKDGFRACTVSPGEFLALTDGLNIRDRRVTEVDESSVFCELIA